MRTTLKGIMGFKCWMLLLIIGLAYGSPYYYREEKHHSEHHKEYSSSDRHEPSHISTAESSPQKYYDGSHFSSIGTPQRYYKLNTSPSSYSNGFSQYSGGQSSSYSSGYHSSGMQTSGFQSGVIPLSSGVYQSSRLQSSGLDQSLAPLLSSLQSTGSEYQSSGKQTSGFQSSHLAPLSSGYNINVEGLKPGSYVIKQVKVYRQPAVYTGFYGSSNHNSQSGGGELEIGQKEENLFDGQHEESLSEGVGEFSRHHVQTTSLHRQSPQVVKTISTHEKKLFGQEQIDIGGFPKDSNIGQQTVDLVGQREEGIFNQHIEDFSQQQERGDLEIGDVQENSNVPNKNLVKTIQISPGNARPQGYKYYEKRIITYGTPEQKSDIYKQAITQHGSPGGNLYGPTISRTPNGFGSIVSGSSLHREHTSYDQEAIESKNPSARAYNSQPYIRNPDRPLALAQPRYTGSLEIGQQEEKSYFQQSQDFGPQPEDLGQQLVKDSLEIGQESEDLGQQLVKDSIEIGKQSEDLGQQLIKDSLENGQQSDDGGQKEDKTIEQQTHSWQRHVNISRLEVSGQRIEPMRESPRRGPENFGQLQTGSLEIGHQQTTYSKPQVLVKENVTRTLIVGHNLPTTPFSSKVNNDHFFEGQKGFLEKGQKEENLGQSEMTNLETGQREETLGTGQQLDNFGQLPETGDLLFGHNEDCLHGQLTESDNLELGQREESTIDIHQSALPVKLIGQPTRVPTQSNKMPYVNTFKQEESHYNEFKQSGGMKTKEFPSFQQRHDTTLAPIRINQEFINKSPRTNYLESQKKAEELALLFGSEDISKERTSQQEIDLYQDKLKTKERGTATTKIHEAEIHELGQANTDLKETDILPNKQITAWESHKEEHGLNYPSPSQTSSYSSKKYSKHYEEKQIYNSHPVVGDYGSQRLTYNDGYKKGGLINSGEKTYINDQPIQRTHTSGSQFSFSSTGTDDKHKAIDDFLSELDKDIARTNYKERQNQGAYSQSSPGAISRSGTSGTSYFSEKTVSHSSSSSHTSSGTASGGDRSWYRKIGDSIGSSYNQAKDKAKEIVKSVKQSVGYTSS